MNRNSVALSILSLGVIFLIFSVSEIHKVTAQSVNNCSAMNISIGTGDKFAVLTVDASTMDSLSSGSSVQTLIANKVYRCFNDVFDFIFVIRNSGSSDFNQYNMSAITAWRSSDFGSASRLKSVNVLPARSNIINGATLHELAHTWGNDILPGWGFIPSGQENADVFQCGSGVGNSRGGHWGIMYPGGQLGGFQRKNLREENGYYYVDQGFSSHTNSNGNGENGQYSMLELYLMGLAMESEVGEIKIFENPTDFYFERQSVQLPNGSTDFQDWPSFKATPRVYTMTQVKAKLRAKGTNRVPAAYTSGTTKTFSLLTILITATAPTQAEKNEMNKQLEWFIYTGDNMETTFANQLKQPNSSNLLSDKDLLIYNNFNKATKKRGRLEIVDLLRARK